MTNVNLGGIQAVAFSVPVGAFGKPGFCFSTMMMPMTPRSAPRVNDLRTFRFFFCAIAAQMPPQRTIAEPFNISATTMMVSQLIGEWYRGRRLSSRLGAGDATEPHYR